MALAKARGSLVVKGGGSLQIREISPSASDAFLSVGYVKATNFNNEHAMVESITDEGLVVQYLSSGEKFMMTVTLMQTAIDELNLLKDAGDDTVYEGYYHVALPSGQDQEINIPLMKFRRGFNISRQSGEQTVEAMVQALSVKAAMTRNPTAYNIAAGAYFVLIENATAQGAPVDTASSVYSTLF